LGRVVPFNVTSEHQYRYRIGCSGNLDYRPKISETYYKLHIYTNIVELININTFLPSASLGRGIV